VPNYSVEGWNAYWVAIAAVSVAAVLRFVLGLIEPGVLYFALFYPAVLLATLVGGYRAGLVATVLSLVVVWYCFLPPEFEFVFKNRGSVLNITLFAGSAGLLVWLTNSYRRTVYKLIEADRQRQLLFDELKHRSRNNLAVAQSIVTNSLKKHPELSSELLGRLRAVLSSDDLLLTDQKLGEQLRNIINAELEPYGLERYEAVGTEIVLNARHARNWALIIHELTTNAAKYGALHAPAGKVLVTWFLKDGSLDFEWCEVGAVTPDASVPSSGFGTKLVDAMCRALGGQIVRNFEDGGFRCQISVPMPADVSQSRSATSASSDDAISTM